MRIAIGTDHHGFKHKQHIIAAMPEITWRDEGCFSQDHSDYPHFAKAVVYQMMQQNVDYGLLLCGTGIGMSIAANRYKGIYAGLAWNEDVARKAREDDNVNILVLPADYLNHQQAVRCIKSWLQATFKGANYLKRLMILDE